MGFEKALRAVKVIKDQIQYRSQSLLNLARCYFSQQKWGPSPSTLIEIYKQCVRPIFEYSLSTITTSDYTISKIKLLQNKFTRLALRLSKYICPKLLHDSSGLPYVNDRLLSCASKSLDRIAQNPLVEEMIMSNRLNPAWDCLFPNAIMGGPSCKSLV